MDLRSKRKNKGEGPQAPARPPEDVVWEIIQDLESSTLIADKMFKEFYIRLTNALRQYLENQLQISALDRTTFELMNDVKARKMQPELSRLLKMVFENADLVKFAKFTPRDEDAFDDLHRVKEFVNSTIPKKETQPPKEKIPV